jgi:glutathione S-transferase
MSEVILHHYEMSPFGRAMRMALNIKQMAWKSVEQPVICPKPDLSALTGGYERIPVLQIGADIFCDTDCITDALEAHKSAPSLYPEPLGRTSKLIALWAGASWFMPAVGTAMSANPDMMDETFWKDRETRFGMKKSAFLPAIPHLQGQFAAGGQALENALADGRDFIAGDLPGHADCTLYACVAFAGLSGLAPSALGPHVAAWFDRLSAIGIGDGDEAWHPQQAIDHAKAHEPMGDVHVDPAMGFTAGQKVAVKTESPDPAIIVGILVGLNAQRITLERHSDAAGRVHVHLPLLGQILMPA